MSKVVSDQPPRAADEPGSARDERLYHMRIDRDGVWHHQGRPISRKPLVKLFASVLRREADGDYWLVTPVERGRIEIEDAPFVITELDAEGSGAGQTIRMKTSLDEWVTVGPDHPLNLRLPKKGPGSDPQSSQDSPSPRDPLPSQGPLSSQDPLPYIDVRPGLEGRLLRPIYYELVELGDSHEVNGVLRYGVWSAGRFFPLE
ncbi:MAG: DUF1285 domain-containing protein [Pseudomonadota bacterium]